MKDVKKSTEEVKNIIASELAQFMEQVDLDTIAQVAQLIMDSERQGGRLHISGIGKPSYVARYAASLLSSVGTPSYFLDGTEAVHGSAGQVKAGDVVIAISNSGNTEELLRSIHTLNLNGAQCVAVTSNEESQLAKASLYTLKAKVNQEGDYLGLPPRASYLAEVIVLQLLSVHLQYAKELTMETYGTWHPGGNIGKLSAKENQ